MLGLDRIINGIDRLPVDGGLPKTVYGEILVGELFPQFQHSFEYTVDNTDLTTNTVVNGGTVTQADGMAVLSTSTTAGSSAMMESYQHGKYRSGIGVVTRFTALYTSPVATTEQYLGIMDEPGNSAAFKNGYAIGYDGLDFGIHRFQNDTKISIKLADCDDPLDGSGASRMTIDPTKLNIFEIRFQYLGAGAIEYRIEDDSTGEFFTFHSILYTNYYIEPSVHNPNFHFILWASNKATTSNIIIKTGSFSYFTEGRTTFIELHQPQQSSGLREKTGVTTEVAIFTIRNRANYVGKTNFIDIFIENVLASIEASSANNLGSVRFVKNATLGGTPSYTNINVTNSVVEIDIAGTTVAGGKEIAVIPLAGKNDKDNLDLTPFRIILKHEETLTVAGKSANNATINSAVLWRELF